MREQHGQSKTKLYGVWEGIKRRCLNKNDKYYFNYGGRGIDICNEWIKFSPFMKWSLLNGYKEGLQIDRIDNNKGYYPNNCRFVIRKINQNNMRNNVKITAFNEIKNLSEWADDPRCKVKYNTLLYRILIYKIPSEQAITMSKLFSGITSKYRGVSYDKSKHKYLVQMKINYKQIYLGRFHDERIAAGMYNVYAYSKLGNKAILNDLRQ